MAVARGCLSMAIPDPCIELVGCVLPGVTPDLIEHCLGGHIFPKLNKKKPGLKKCLAQDGGQEMSQWNLGYFVVTEVDDV